MRLLLISLGLGTLGFLLIWFWVRPTQKQTGPVSFDVLGRLNERIALRNPPRHQWLSGLSYSSLFYIGLPILIWRYGIYRALFLIILPIGISFGITSVSAGFMDFDSGERLIYGFLILIILRAIFGVKVVAANDFKYRRNALVRRGWKVLGSCEATSKKEAIAYFQDLFGFEHLDKIVYPSKGVHVSDAATKICIRCRQGKPLSSFYLKLRDDYVHECIDCRLVNSTGQSASQTTLSSEAK